MKLSRGIRVLRGTLGAAFALFVAALSHVAGGGALPSPAALALAFALASLLCIALSGRALSLWRTAASVGASQALFHGLFSGLTGGVSVLPGSSAGHAGHSSTTSVLVDSAAHTASTHSPAMWLAHAVAAIITIIALRYADTALHTVREAAHLVFGITASLLVPVHVCQDAPRVRIGSTKAVRPKDLSVLFSALRHRGPPAFAA
ncbi:MAG TPA: hypothetical protein VGP24_01860 [Glaciihabitans sp.]|nr:hypothetical protein [Glaciihabitans sp.]